MFTINVNCICCEKGRDKTVFVTANFWSRSGSRLLPKISGVEVTPSVTSVESSEQFWLNFNFNAIWVRLTMGTCRHCFHHTFSSKSFGFQRNCHISRIVWCGNATNELKQPRQ